MQLIVLGEIPKEELKPYDIYDEMNANSEKLEIFMCGYEKKLQNYKEILKNIDTFLVQVNRRLFLLNTTSVFKILLHFKFFVFNFSM